MRSGGAVGNGGVDTLEKVKQAPTAVSCEEVELCLQPRSRGGLLLQRSEVLSQRGSGAHGGEARGLVCELAPPCNPRQPSNIFNT